MCPHCAMVTSRAPAMPTEISCARSGGVAASASATSTTAGQPMAASVPRVGTPDHRGLLAGEYIRVGVLRHHAHVALERAVRCTRPMHERREPQRGKRSEGTGARHRDLIAVSLRLLGDVGARGGVEQGECRHPLRRMPHDPERDVSAERMAREREARRGIGQDAAHDLSDRIRARRVGNGDRPRLPQRRHLRRAEPRRAHETRDQQWGGRRVPAIRQRDDVAVQRTTGAHVAQPAPAERAAAGQGEPVRRRIRRAAGAGGRDRRLRGHGGLGHRTQARRARSGERRLRRHHAEGARRPAGGRVRGVVARQGAARVGGPGLSVSAALSAPNPFRPIFDAGWAR